MDNDERNKLPSPQQLELALQFRNDGTEADPLSSPEVRDDENLQRALFTLHENCRAMDWLFNHPNEDTDINKRFVLIDRHRRRRPDLNMWRFIYEQLFEREYE